MSQNFIKNFADWFKLKPLLDNSKKRPLFKDREVWMCHFGSNVGYELDGKNIEYLRPIIVFKKLSKNTLLGIPLTSNQKVGSWYSPSSINNLKGNYCLNQIRSVDAKRLKYLMGQIDSNDFNELKQNFYNMIEN